MKGCREQGKKEKRSEPMYKELKMPNMLLEIKRK
jgi:hypothetical protein